MSCKKCSRSPCDRTTICPLGTYYDEFTQMIELSEDIKELISRAILRALDIGEVIKL